MTGTTTVERTAESFVPGGAAIIFGASGGIGSALSARLRGSDRFAAVLHFARSGERAFDLTDEASIAAAAAAIRGSGIEPRLVIDATGVLQGAGCVAEKTWGQIDADAMLRAFALNAVGPALLMKHVLPLLPRAGKSVFATLSARVGSIGDNRLGGWYSYRASKAALNQIVRTAAVELRRKRPDAVCVALHPGTVDTPLTAPFHKSGLDVQTPDAAAERLLAVIETLGPWHSGGFLDYRGASIPW